MRKGLKRLVMAAAGLLGTACGVLFYGVMDFLYDPEYFRHARKPRPSRDTAPGEAWLEPPSVRAGTGYATVELRFRCGPGGISEDGGLKVGICRLVDFGSAGKRPAFVYAHGWGLLQNRHPRLPNYFTCRLHTSGGARLEVRSKGYFPLRGSVRLLGREFLRRCGVSLPPLDIWFLYLEESKIRIRVRGDRLQEGDEIVIVLGDRGGGGRGWKVPAKASRVDLAVEVDEKATGIYRFIDRDPVLEAVGGRAVALQPVLSSFDGQGRGKVLLRAVDGDGEVDGDFRGQVRIFPSPGLEIEEWRVFRPEDGGVVSVPCRASAPGLYRVRVEGEGIRGESNPALFREGMRLYWGDLHVHTCLCDGLLEPREFYRMARDVEGLDFASITTHDSMELFEPSGREEEWSLLRELKEEFTEPGRFVVLLGYEWSDHRWGHRGVYYAPHEADPRVYPWCLPDSDTPEKLEGRLRDHHALVIPHHTAWRRIFVLPFNWAKVLRMRVPPAYAWWGPESEAQRLVEIYSMHGASERYDGPFPVTHGRFPPWCPAFLKDDRVRPGYGNYYLEALARGLRLGVVAGSDRHDYPLDPRRHPVDVYPRGLTGVWAEELDEESLWRSLWNRRTYGTTGVRILLEFFADEAPLGSEYYCGQDPVLRGRVVGTAPLRLVEVVRHDRRGYSSAWWGGGKMEEVFQFRDRDLQGEGFYFLRVEQEDGHCAWSSPIWVLR